MIHDEASLLSQVAQEPGTVEPPPATISDYEAARQDQAELNADHASPPASAHPRPVDYVDDLGRVIGGYIAEHALEIWSHIPFKELPVVPVIPVRKTVIANPFAGMPTAVARPSVLTTKLPGLYEASAFLMWRHDTVFNTHLVITWRLLGIHDDARAARLLAKFNQEAKKWMKVGAGRGGRVSRRARFWAPSSLHSYVYVHEYSRDQGFHTHQLCVVPRDKAAEFERWSMKRLRELAGRRRLHPDAVYFGPRTKKRGFQPKDGNEPANVNWCWALFRYIAKSTPEFLRIQADDGTYVPAREVFKLKPHWPTGEVFTKRLAGWSEHLGPRAQARAGFQSRYLTGDWDRLYDGKELEEGRRHREMEIAARERDEMISNLVI